MNPLNNNQAPSCAAPWRPQFPTYLPQAAAVLRPSSPTSVVGDASTALKAVVVAAAACGGVAVLALGAWFVYTRWVAPEFGIASRHPLGTFEAIDRSLVGRGLDKSEEPPQAVGYTDTLHTFCYRGTAAGEERLPELVVVITDRDQEVQVVAGQWTGSEESSIGAPEAGRFLADFWRAAGAGEPEFASHASVAPTAKRAFVSSQKFEALWVRQPDPPDQRIVIRLAKRDMPPWFGKLLSHPRSPEPE